MKAKKEIMMIIMLLILILVVLSVIGFAMIKNKNKMSGDQLDSSIISNLDYDVSYRIDEEHIDLTLTNKTNDDILFKQIVIKYNGNTIAGYQHDLILSAKNVFPISFANNYDIKLDAKIEVFLYRTITDDLKSANSYTCKKEEKTTTDYNSAYKYSFTYTDGIVHSTKVYEEYQFKNEDIFKNFKYKVEVDSAYIGESENDEENLIRRFIWPVTYDMPNTILNTESNYLKFLEDSYGFSCVKEN